jgi:hypothetical protein
MYALPASLAHVVDGCYLLRIPVPQCRRLPWWTQRVKALPGIRTMQEDEKRSRRTGLRPVGETVMCTLCCIDDAMKKKIASPRRIVPQSDGEPVRIVRCFMCSL